MARYAIEVVVIEVDDNGDEVCAIKTFETRQATGNKRVALHIANEAKLTALRNIDFTRDTFQDQYPKAKSQDEQPNIQR